MKSYTTDKIINISVAGHGSTGKTMVSEMMALASGKIHKPGSIDAGDTVSDYREFEKNNQHSVSMTLLQLEHGGKKLNVIDTPGYMDFLGEMRSAVRVSDVTGVVVSSVNGIEIGANLAIDEAKELNVPRFFVINMIDRDQSDYNSVLSALKESFGHSVFPFTMPGNEGEAVNQVIDVVSKKEITDQGGKSSAGDLSEENSSKVESLNSELVELVAESDEALLEKYFESGELSADEIENGIKSAILNGSIVPVFATSATKDVGVRTMMDLLSSYFPTAADTNMAYATKADSDEAVDRNPSSSDPFSALVFKTMNEEHVGEMSMFRVFSGSFSTGGDVKNVDKNSIEKMRQVYFVCGSDRADASKIEAGDIGVALKLKDTKTGDTLSDPSNLCSLRGINFPGANMRFAVSPSTRGEEEKMANGLSTMNNEDPTFTYNVDPELKQTIVSGQGELHINLALARIKDRFSVDLIKETPKVPYRETITKGSSAKYRHKKQSGGSGQFAEVWLKIEPCERGTGVDFNQSLVGQNVDRGFVPSVEKGIDTVCTDGVIAGCKVVDVKIDFYDGKMHPVDSNDMAFQIAGRHAFSDAFKTAAPKLLEPIYKIKIKVPEDAMGDIMGDVSSRRGKVGGMEAEGMFQVINAEVPLANLHDYATALKSMSNGRGFFSQEFSHYEDMPHTEAQKVISAWEAARAAGE